MGNGRPPHGQPPVTRSRLVADLRSLGVRRGGVLMTHTRMSAIGWVIGGSETIVRALLDCLGPDGTLMAYAGWEDNPYDLYKWPEEWQRASRGAAGVRPGTVGGRPRARAHPRADPDLARGQAQRSPGGECRRARRGGRLDHRTPPLR